MMFGLAKPVPAAPTADAEDDTTSDDVEAELAAMRTKPKPAMKVNTIKIIFYLIKYMVLCNKKE
jgi:hypothetical protein